MGVFGTSVDQILFAESAPLAGAQAFVRAVLDGGWRLATLGQRSIDEGVVAEQCGTLGIEVGWFLQAEAETGIFTTAVVSPVLGGELFAFNLDWGWGGGDSSVLSHNGNSHQGSAQNNGLHHFG